MPPSTCCQHHGAYYHLAIQQTLNEIRVAAAERGEYAHRERWGGICVCAPPWRERVGGEGNGCLD